MDLSRVRAAPSARLGHVAIEGQSYARLAPGLALQVGRYSHAKQFKRICKALKKPNGYACRVMRDLRRHLQDIPEGIAALLAANNAPARLDKTL